MAHIMPLGISEFSKVREEHSFYVDKSRLVGDILRDRSEVILLPRPRRFGKTLNLTMLREFFDDQVNSRPLFEGLAVCDDLETMAHMGQYPTIYITFKDLKPDNWQICQERLIIMVSRMFDAHWARIEASELPVHKKELAYSIVTGKASLATCQDGLSLLTELLRAISGKRVVLLIDEYDSPIHAGYQNGYRKEIVSFMRDFLSGGFKDNPALKKGVLTGILRVAKDSIFSGLNNLSVYTLLDKPFSTYFGFTEREVVQMLSDLGMADRDQEVQRWYNGYRFGEETIYNPWSLLSIFRDPQAPFTPHWINTANNSLIRDLVVEERAISLAELTTLLAGEPVERVIDPFVALNDLKPESIWGLLLLSGYLTLGPVQPNQDMFYALRIPNFEVHTFFASTVSHWLGQQSHSDALMRSLLDEDMSRFAELLAETIVQVLSYHDTSGRDSERVYHAFLAGLMVKLSQSHQVLSNRESGFGRYDLLLSPNQVGQTGFIFEFKRGESGKLEDLAQSALEQIRQQDYQAMLRGRGINRIREIGLAFDGKRVALASAVWDQATAARIQDPVVSPPQSHLQATMTSDRDENTSILRREQIAKGSRDPALLLEEAIWLQKRARYAEALAMLEQAQRNEVKFGQDASAEVAEDKP